MVETDKIRIDQQEDGIRAALTETDSFIRYTGLTGKKAIHLRLLVEETLGMVRMMAGDFDASFWLESDGGEYRVRLAATTLMNKEKKSDLLSVSTSGRNAFAKGFMGGIRELIEDSLLKFDDRMTIKDEQGSAVTGYNLIGFDMPGGVAGGGSSPMMKEQLIWSLNQYRDALEEAPDTDVSAKEAWDRLEKSIVASIASDVIVGVKKDRVDMTIVMK